MKTAEYIKKFKLDVNDWVPQREFLFELSSEFLSYLETTKSKDNKIGIQGYEQAIRVCRQKWDAISKKMKGTGLPEGMWKYFYATFLAKTREQMFPDEMKKRQEERAQKQAMWEERKNFKNAYSFENFFWNDILRNMLFQFAPSEPNIDDLLTLNLQRGATAEEVKEAYRKLAISHHPDKGGNAEDFLKITEAKNRCLGILKSAETTC